MSCRRQSGLRSDSRRYDIEPLAIKILVVDHEPILRRGMALLIGEVPHMTVIGEAADIKEALSLIDQHDPDVVVTELFPDAVWFKFISQMSGRGRPKVLVFSHADELNYGPRTLRLGARGYVQKSETPEVLLGAIRLVAVGDVAISERLSTRLMKEVVFGLPQGEKSSVSSLTNRQLEVFELIGQSWNTREIAERLHLSIKTVNVYRAKIKMKLELQTTTNLSQAAVEWVQRQKHSRTTS